MALSDLFPPLKISIDRIGLITEADGTSHEGFNCVISAPPPATALTVGTPVTISGTLFGSVIVLQVKLGSTVLGAASIVGNTWSYVYTPQGGDVGAQTINATATHTSGAQVNAPGVAVTVAASTDFATFFTNGTVLQSVQSDKGVTTGATFTWADQSGNNKHYTQTVSGKQPALTAGLNGNPGLAFTFGGQTLLTSALNLPAPGTTPTWVGMVWRNITPNGNGRPLCSTDGLSQIVYMSAADTKLQQFNGSPGNIDLGFTANAWECDEFYFSNSASDYIKRGSGAPVTGTAAGNSVSTGRNIGGSDATSNYITAEVLHVIYVNSKQVSAIANWRAAVATKYGVSVST